jgi:hypothetical protein
MPDKVLYSPKTKKDILELLITPYPPENGYAGIRISIKKDELWNKDPKGKFEIMKYEPEEDEWYSIKEADNVAIPEPFLSKTRVMFSPSDISISKQLKLNYVNELFESLK